MPIISQIGRRSWKVRLVFGAMFLLLGLGAITMIYPLLLMLSGAAKSEVDYDRVTPIPEYFSDDSLLWAKYLQSKYNDLPSAERAMRRTLGSWKKVSPPEKVNEELAREFMAFRQQTPWPMEWYTLGHFDTGRTLAKNGRAYRQAVKEKYKTVGAYSEALGVRLRFWSQVVIPTAPFNERRFTWPATANYQMYYDFKAIVPPADRVVVDLDAAYVHQFLMTTWPSIATYNTAHGTTFKSYKDVHLPTRAPSDEAGRKDWNTFVRRDLNLVYARIDPSAATGLRTVVSKKYLNEIEALNRAWKTNYASFDQIEIPTDLTGRPIVLADLNTFVKDETACPIEALSVHGPRQAFEEFVAAKRGVDVSTIAPLTLPLESVDYLDFQSQKGSLRWEFLTRNFKAVLDYILVQGNGIRNTVIFCLLMIGTNLLVNPLAAYALSRYRPPSMYSILLFCMCTMAFPAEVTMIPSFLLLKRFPVLAIVVAVAAAWGASWLLHRALPRVPVLLKGVIGVGVGIAAGWWLLPTIAQRTLGWPDTSVSLLNTFWALILPGMANGFSIFLLKGFFDSLPKELYEAADIDGASEWQKFWMITMSLSKPILAVMALGAFTAAYSEFLMALVIIPDQSMWTLMVWLYQMQNWSHPTVVYASLVIAAIPTFLIFVFCQNLIMRGIVVPTEK